MKHWLTILSLAILILWTKPLSAGVEEILASGIPIKSGTPYILAGEWPASKTAASYRTSGMQYNVLSDEGHFRVHFNITKAFDNVDSTDSDTNGVPDYVDSCLVYLEYAYDLLIGDEGIGFDPPLPDGTLGGGPEIDVYLKNLSNVYGMTTPSLISGSTSSAYMEIDNNFSESIYYTKGLDALKVTTAHEFFHAVQFRLYNDMDFNWWMEHSSVWFEEYAWDEVNDYYLYLQYFFNYRDYPLDTRNGSFEYGAGIWAMYLAKQHGPTIITDLWKHNTAIDSQDIADFDTVIPGGLDHALSEFAVWNYFTGARGNSDFYPDSPDYTVAIQTDASANKNPATGTLETQRLTSKYVELLFSGDWNEEDYLKVTVTPSDQGTYANSLIFYNTPADYDIHNLETQSETIHLGGTWDRAILVTTCSNTDGAGYYGFTFETELITDVEELPTEFVLHGNYPNPFNPSTTISFTVPDKGGTVSISAYSITGQKVADIFNGRLDAGEKQMLWKPDNLSNGAYIVRLSSPWGTKTVKTLLLN